jgi:ParB family chromosome partitioning protein
LYKSVQGGAAVTPLPALADHPARHEDVPVGKIKIGRRYRVESGDLKGLAASIQEMGLLQPIGVDPYYQLIFGARRLQACADILHWEKIPAVILDLDSLLAGEYAENEFRKAFTPSEQAAIGAAIERELGNRKPGPKCAANAAQLPEGRTSDLAAKRAGFNSAETFERAKTVVEKGSRELVTAMDEKRISINAAAAIASQPKEEQSRILTLPKDGQRAVVKAIQKTKADRESSERLARDIRVFRGFAEAVEQIANFHEEAGETWAGLSRVYAHKFSQHLDAAITCLARIKKEHPNATKRPDLVR